MIQNLCFWNMKDVQILRANESVYFSVHWAIFLKHCTGFSLSFVWMCLWLQSTRPGLGFDWTLAWHWLQPYRHPAVALNPSSSPSLSFPFLFFHAPRVSFVWRRQPQWWRGWKHVWITEQLTTVSSAWTLTLWPVRMSLLFKNLPPCVSATSALSCLLMHHDFRCSFYLPSSCFAYLKHRLGCSLQ